MNYKKLFFNSICIFLLCFIIHFTYSSIPSFFTSIFAPVNESIAEHVKMLFSAGIVFSIISYFFLKDNNLFLTSYIRSMLLIILLLIFYLPIYYLFGENMTLTLIILFITIFLTEVILSFIPLKKEYKTLNILGLFLIIINYILFTTFTYNPPKIDLFFDHENNKYGIDILNNRTS